MLARPVGQMQQIANIKTLSNAPAVNTAAVVTLNPPATPNVSDVKQRVVVHHIQLSYNAAPTGGNLQVSGSVSGVVLNLDITVQDFAFDTLIPLAPGENLTITLAAAGAAVTGKLNAQAEVVPL